MQGKIKIEKQGKTQTLDFGWIDKKDFEHLKERYLALGYQIKEVGNGTINKGRDTRFS